MNRLFNYLENPTPEMQAAIDHLISAGYSRAPDPDHYLFNSRADKNARAHVTKVGLTFERRISHAPGNNGTAGSQWFTVYKFRFQEAK